MNSIHKRLEGGDLRSIGEADTVVEDLHKDPSLFNEVFDCLYSDTPGVRMRSADVIEKFTSKHPEYLNPYKINCCIKYQELIRKKFVGMYARSFQD
jgi:hypothetical protein